MTLEEFDRELLKQHSADIIIGLDEAGRGPLAGPVSGGAFVYSPRFRYPVGIKDSKKLSPLARENICDKIKTASIPYSTAFVSAKEIDKINILNAALSAMKSALEKLGIEGNALVVVDGNKEIPGLKFRQITLVGGDNKSLAVAGASIMAKVARDSHMLSLDTVYPAYGFAKHKGYGTKAHIEAIRLSGLCEEHRKTFTNGIVQ